LYPTLSKFLVQEKTHFKTGDANEHKKVIGTLSEAKSKQIIQQDGKIRILKKNHFFLYILVIFFG